MVSDFEGDVASFVGKVLICANVVWIQDLRNCWDGIWILFYSGVFLSFTLETVTKLFNDNLLDDICQ